MIFLLLLSVVPLTWASFCGENGVPFSLEILPNGNPVLGCAQPSCIALSEGEDDSIFEADGDGQFDGYFRDEERSSHLQANKFKANCSGKFDAVTCPKKNQWVGGIDFVQHPRQPLILQCCTFEGLRFSQDVGVTTIGVGEAVTGGEVIRDGRQISFDIIANVRKVLAADDHSRIVYEVTVRRMNCLPDPNELQVPFDDDVADEIQRVLGTSSNRDPEKEEIADQKALQSKPSKHNHPNEKPPHKPELTFGAPIYDPASDAAKKYIQPIQPHPRYVEDRKPTEYSTTEPPPQIVTTVLPTLPPATAPPPPPPSRAPVTAQPDEDEIASIVTPSMPAPKVNFDKPVPATIAPTQQPTPPPFAPFGLPPQPLPGLPVFPGFGVPPQPGVLAAPPQFPAAPIPPPPQQFPPFPNPFASFANPFAPPTPPTPTSFNGVFGAPPGTGATIPETQAAIVQPILRTSSIHKHNDTPSPPSPPSPPAPPTQTLAPLLQPPNFPTIFGPFPLQG